MSVSKKKSDNSSLVAKLKLRRHFLDTYHRRESFSVLDCCQGDAAIWSTLRREYPCRYWGVDTKARKGRMKIDSVRILAQPGWTQDVIDIDTYGSPWNHWFAMLPNLRHAATVFLTMGRVLNSGFAVNQAGLERMGLTFKKELPRMFWPNLFPFALQAMLSAPADYGVCVVEAVEAEPTHRTNVRYIGVRLEPHNGNRNRD